MALVTVPRYTVDDLDQFAEDGNRCELLDGVLLVIPAPPRTQLQPDVLVHPSRFSEIFAGIDAAP